MDHDEKFGAMVDICLKANLAVVETGTPAMVAMMRALLWQLGQEAAQRAARAEDQAQRPPQIYYANMSRVIAEIQDGAQASVIPTAAGGR